MVAYKTGSFQRILKSLEPECRTALVYGPDAGLVAERAAALADAFAGKRKEATEIVRREESRPCRRRGPARRSHAEGAARSASCRSARHRGGRAQAGLGIAQAVRKPQDGGGAAELQRRALGLR